MLLDSQVGLVVRQPVENVLRIPNGGIDDLVWAFGVAGSSFGYLLLACQV